MARPARGAVPRDAPVDDTDGDVADLSSIVPERGGPLATPFRFSGVSLLAVAIVAAAISAGGYIFWVQHAHKVSPAPVKNVASAAAPQAPPAAKVATPKLATAKDGDLAAGIDGSAADNDLPYVFRRQPTFYRTLQPVGTVIIDKLQHFLYLIQPNNVALRYGIGLGEQCTELAGLRHVASKAEWPSWQATPDMIERKLAKPGVLAGGAGNPLGARVHGARRRQVAHQRHQCAGDRRHQRDLRLRAAGQRRRRGSLRPRAERHAGAGELTLSINSPCSPCARRRRARC